MGPTGVGKTETALTLARFLFGDEKRLFRFDMSEYADPGSALRLIEGRQGEGALTSKVRAQPFCVLLFDEVEKAHPGAFDLLLQVLGEGRLTDGSGETVSFTHTLVVLTSNLGAEARPAVGFQAGGDDRRRYLEAAERFFRPELLNRIDHVVPYASLDGPVLEAIARRMLELAMQREGFLRRGLALELDESVVARVVAVGTDTRHGARPLARAVESEVVVPLARRLGERPIGSGRWRLVFGAAGLTLEPTA
jgi:ATP-dependent Clp protease ATP-binding subunit ClpC